MPSGFTMDTSLFKSGRDLDRRLDRAIRGVCRFWDGRIEAAMKYGAPWTDRTSNARNGLSAEYEQVNGNHGITLSHGVDYGIYLETIQEGKYAIILPTIRTYAPKVIGTTTKLLDKLDKKGVYPQ